jgi:hypothetical protein
VGLKFWHSAGTKQPDTALSGTIALILPTKMEDSISKYGVRGSQNRDTSIGRIWEDGCPQFRRTLDGRLKLIIGLPSGLIRGCTNERPYMPRSVRGASRSLAEFASSKTVLI